MNFHNKLFEDRHDAGQQLADALGNYANRDDVVVLGLPRGGVPVAYEIALRLDAPLDIFVVRKLGAPGHSEMAIGAIAVGNIRVLNQDMIQHLHISSHDISLIEAEERRELERREALYRGDYSMTELDGKIAILVDDGLATGATMRAAIQALKQHQPTQIVVAVPTASRETCEEFNGMPEVDEVICLMTPRGFRAVAQWYTKFDQTSDDEVRELLLRARKRILETS